MKNFSPVIMLVLLLFSCSGKNELSSVNPENWQNRMYNRPLSDSLETGCSYLSVYSQIYSTAEHRTHNLTATVSMRNVNRLDSIFLLKAEYFNTRGKHIRTYFDQVIFIVPLETVEIVIDEQDMEGGTGANFLFDWKMKQGLNEPLFEGVMISTSGQQGLSFATKGVRLK